MLAQTSNNYISALNDRKTNTCSFYNLIFQNHPNSSWGRLNGDGVHTLRYYLLTFDSFLTFYRFVYAMWSMSALSARLRTIFE